MDNNNGEHKQRSSASRGGRPAGKGGYRGGKPGNSKGNFRGSKPSGKGRGGKPGFSPKGEDRGGSDFKKRNGHGSKVRVISPSIRMSTVLSGTLAMIGARGIVLLMAATKAAIVGAIAIGAPKSEVSRDATVLTVATKAAIVRLRTVVNLREPKKVLVPNSARPMGLRVSIVAVWAVLKAWVIGLVKARKSVPLPRLRLRVC